MEMLAVLDYHSNKVCADEPCDELIWAATRAEQTVATCFAFLAKVRVAFPPEPSLDSSIDGVARLIVQVVV